MTLNYRYNIEGVIYEAGKCETDGRNWLSVYDNFGICHCGYISDAITEYLRAKLDRGVSLYNMATVTDCLEKSGGIHYSEIVAY